MSTTLQDELKRLTDLDTAVRNYLSHLVIDEQGRSSMVQYWRERIVLLTANEPRTVN